MVSIFLSSEGTGKYGRAHKSTPSLPSAEKMLCRGLSGLKMKELTSNVMEPKNGGKPHNK